MVPHLAVLGIGIAIGITIVGAVMIVEAYRESERTRNRPYGQRRSNSPNRYPTPPPSPPRNRPTNTQPRQRTNRPNVEDRATNTNNPDMESRATSPLPGRHFSEYCRICGDTDVVQFRPCGDYFFCRICASHYEEPRCPMCNTRIQSIS